jgi:hypothetical protein
MNTLWIYYDPISSLFKYGAAALSLGIGSLCLQRYTPRQLLAVFGIGLLVLIVGVKSDNLLQMYLSYIIIIGAKNIPFQQIVKVHFVLCLCFCLFNMVVSEMGMVKNSNAFISDEREGFLVDMVVREDFGYGWSTDYAIHVFFILLDYWILKKGRLRLLEYLLYCFISFFLIVKCDSRMAAGNILFILLFAFYLSRKNHVNRDVGKIVSTFLIVSVPLFAALSLWASIAYDSSDILWVGADLLLSGRLRLGNDAIFSVGIPWFGQFFKMYGAGNAGMGDTEYNFLDCAYIQSFVIWGIILTCIWVFAFSIISKKAHVRKDWVLMSAVFISGIAGLIAPYSFNLKYCILLLATVTSFNVNSLENSKI